MTLTQAKVIFALADNDLNLSATAGVMFMHINSVYYHIDRIHAATGLNPRNFYDLQELLPLAKQRLEENDGN